MTSDPKAKLAKTQKFMHEFEHKDNMKWTNVKRKVQHEHEFNINTGASAVRVPASAFVVATGPSMCKNKLTKSKCYLANFGCKLVNSKCQLAHCYGPRPCEPIKLAN